MNIILPPDVKFVLNMLLQKGYEAFVVGGCVRDILIGQQPNDWDICTSATPEQTIECFTGYHTIKTGLQHGTITLRLNQLSYEITTYRIDGEYKDNRRPNWVEFTKNIQNDLARRDFTINAIAYSPVMGLVDPFNGKGDILAGCIRCVGNAADRFSEDALRIMRAIRFCSILGFKIEKQTSQAIFCNYQLLDTIAVERIQIEFCKLLMGDFSEDVLMNYQEVIGFIIPQAMAMFGFLQNNKYHKYNVWQHTVKSVCFAEKDLVVKLAMFFHDIGKPCCFTQDEEGTGHFYQHQEYSAEIAEQVMKNMRFDKMSVSLVRELVLYHSIEIGENPKEVKRWLGRIGETGLRRLLQVKRADVLAQAEWCQPERLAKLTRLEDLVNDIINQKQCFTIQNLAVNGRDIIGMGVPPGPKVGRLLADILDMVIEEKLENRKEDILQYIELKKFVDDSR